MDELRQDLRYALRTLASKPGFTLVVILTLALGIGANTAIFTLMDQVLFRLLPVKEPERLVVVDAPGPSSGATHNHSDTLTPLSHPMFVELRDKSDAFDGALAEYTAPLHVTVGNQTDQVDGVLVSGTFFGVLGLRPAAGRLLNEDDDRTPGAHPVVVLGHGFWTRRFGADPRVVGQSVLVNGHPMAVVGVAPPGFHGIEVGESADVYVPLMMLPQVIPTWNRGLGDWRVRWLTVMARLKHGLTRDQAAARANVLYSQLLQEDVERIETKSERFRTAFLKKRLELLPGGRGISGLRDQSKTPLLVLMGMVGLVLLIACANVANLLLARRRGRRRWRCAWRWGPAVPGWSGSSSSSAWSSPWREGSWASRSRYGRPTSFSGRCLSRRRRGCFLPIRTCAWPCSRSRCRSPPVSSSASSPPCSRRVPTSRPP